MSVLNLIRPELLKKQPYITNDDQIKHRLHANELPWSVLTTDINLNFYPGKGLQNQLEALLTKQYQVTTDQMLITRGSDEGIDLIMRLFIRANQDACMQCPPTFAMYAFYVHLQQGQIIECALDPKHNFKLSIEHVRNCWQENCKMILLCNPNNPTAHLIDLDFIATLCQEYKNRSVIVVDEAYIEFAEAKSATCLLPQFDNLIILRTLSKAYGLANLRLGVILAQTQLIQAFNTITAPFRLSSVVMELAIRALANPEWFSMTMNKIKKARSKLVDELAFYSVIETVYPTETNFILIKTKHASELASWFANHDIAIRSFPANSLLHHYLRITVGDEAQNMLLLRALASFQSTILGFKNAKNFIY